MAAIKGENLLTTDNREEIKQAVRQSWIDRIERDFTYHAPKGDQPARYEQIRNKAKELALLLVDVTPQSREQSLAITHLEQTVFFANAAIARNE